MKIISQTPEFTFDDVLLLTGRANYRMEDDHVHAKLTCKISRTISLDLPIMSAPMPGISGAEMCIALGEVGAIGCLHPYQTFEDQLAEARRVKEAGVPVAVGILDHGEDGFKHIGNLLDVGVDIISIESEQAHNTHTLEFIRRLKDRYPRIDISVGVIITPEACEELIDAGADSLRAGIGGGSHCTTRLVTGVGRPQLSTVQACYEVTRSRGIPLLSDTGIRYAGDIAKAMVFGADGVVIGGLFAGTDECPGDLINRGGQRFKKSWGMCTATAVSRSQNYHETGDQDESAPRHVFEEGVEGLIPYAGSARDIAMKLKRGVQRAMWYMGVTNVTDMRESAQVVITSQNTYAENKPRI